MHTVAMRTVTIRATAIQVRVQAARRLSGCVMVRYSTVARLLLFLLLALPEQAHPDRTPRRLRPAPSPTQDASAACHVGLIMSTVAHGVQGWLWHVAAVPTSATSLVPRESVRALVARFVTRAG